MNIPTNLGLTAKDIIRAVQRRDVIVVIDVLRCCSTIVTALANAADGVIPTRTVREAHVLHRKDPELILAGERKGIKPKGFDLGNSPLEFTPQKVGGRHVILTTTSGTKAIISSRKAKYVLIGAFLNAKVVAKTVLKIAEHEKTGISLIASGTDGHFSLEDFICAGAVARGFSAHNIEHSDAVLTALLAFQRTHKFLDKIIQCGNHARRLKRLGFEEDVKFCCQLDIFQIVPILRGKTIISSPKLDGWDHTKSQKQKTPRINEISERNLQKYNFHSTEGWRGVRDLNPRGP